jgi:hypothetical protein
MPNRRGMRGLRGAPGSSGARGLTGKLGPIGPSGPAGPTATRADILAVVQDEFHELGKQLQIQLERTAQMQMQLDTIQALVKQLLAKA